MASNERCWQCSGQHGPWRPCEGDLLDVLGGGGKQALEGNGRQAPETGITVPVELFGVGKGALDRLLAPLVDTLAPRGETVCVGSFARVGPDMANDEAGGVAARCARRKQWACPCDCPVLLVMGV